MKNNIKLNDANTWFAGLSKSLLLLFLLSLASTLTAATVDDLTFALINNDTEYSITSIDSTATGTLTVPATYQGLPVTAIGSYGLALSEITEVYLPNSITTMADWAFLFSPNLTRVNIPTGVTRIPFGTFSDCTSLREVVFHDGITEIGVAAFYCNSGLTSLTLPAQLSDLASSAFAWCQNIEGVVNIPPGVTQIAQGTFNRCEKVTEFIFEGAITQIEDEAFLNNFDLTSITFEGAAPTLVGTGVFTDIGRDVEGGTIFYISNTHKDSYADWSGDFRLVRLEADGTPILEVFATSVSFDASSNAFAIHSFRESGPSGAIASVAVQQRASLATGDWVAVAEADITETTDSATGVVTRSLTLPNSNTQGFYRLHYAGSGSESTE